MIFGRIICYFYGHKRGRALEVTAAEMAENVRGFRCPRCGAQWTRKVSQRKPKQPQQPKEAQ